MTVSSLTNKVVVQPDGVETSFTYNFLVYTESDMLFSADGEEYVASYTMTGLGDNDGGEVVFSNPPPSSIEKLTLYRELPLTQPIPYPTYNPFPSASHEKGQDRTCMMVQQLSEKVGRALKAPVDQDPETDYSLPVYEAGEFWRWDPSTQEISTTTLTGLPAGSVGTDIGDLVQLVDDGAGNPVFPSELIPVSSSDYVGTKDYVPQDIVNGSDGIRYQCKIGNGPSYTVVDPVGDGTGTWVFSQYAPSGSLVTLSYEPTTAQKTQMRIIEANGASVLDTDFPSILTAWGSKIYGNADSTHFNIPNISGRVIRAWDNGAGIDPDAATRTDRGDGTTGDNVGTKQSYGVESHTHSHVAGTTIVQAGAQGGTAPNGASYTTGAYGGNETRMINIYQFVGVAYND